jgi:uncharacterized linocin/CFP29 family protein
MDFILNGQGHGDVASLLMQHNCDVGALRPFIGNDGRTYITINQGGIPTVVPVTNATATLRKLDWIQLDTAIIKAAKPRLRAVADLRSRGLQYNIPNGMGKTTLETESQSDINEASISMDGLRETSGDRPTFELNSLPLPIIHKDFSYSARQVMASRNGGSPLDTTTAELAARRVAEMAEQLLLGSLDEYTYGGGTIYGYKNLDGRMTKVLTSPTDSDWTPALCVQEALEMRLQSQLQYHYGPWVLYTSPSWDIYLDDDYSGYKGDLTLRDRLKKIQGIEDVITLDYLASYDMLMVQMTPDVVREVVGMDITTVQWPTHGGMQLNFKVMCILVPQLRVDANGNGGIVHGAPA